MSRNRAGALISFLWFFGAMFLASGNARQGIALLAGVVFGGFAATALSGDYVELGLAPFGLALMGALSIAPHTLAGSAGLGFGGGLSAIPLCAYRRRRFWSFENAGNIGAALFALAIVRLHWYNGFVIPALGAITLAGSITLVIVRPEPVVRFILWCLMHTLFRLRLEGLENIPEAGAALLVSNHISYADAPLVGCTARKRTVHFLMWQPIYDVPVANYFFRVLKAIPIDERSPKSTVRGLRAAREKLGCGELVGIFPEGSISRSGEVEPFARGFEKVRQGSSAPVIPILIDGLYGHPLSCKGGAPFRSWRKLWRPVVTVRVGTPLDGALSGTELRETVVNLREF
jgi:acyl-[acyl-carrier-protein]-phospholipid O-acyltransferase / long-chain-fatty-acid--[acyl-carrier-protein] ligase